MSAAVNATSRVWLPQPSTSVPWPAGSVNCSRVFCVSGASVWLLRAAWPAVRSLTPVVSSVAWARTVSVEKSLPASAPPKTMV